MTTATERHGAVFIIAGQAMTDSLRAELEAATDYTTRYRQDRSHGITLIGQRHRDGTIAIVALSPDTIATISNPVEFDGIKQGY